LLAFGGKEFLLPSVHVVSGRQGRCFLLFLSLWLDLIQIRMSRAQLWSVQLFLKKRFARLFSNPFLSLTLLLIITHLKLCDVFARCSLAGPGKGMRRSVGSVEDGSGIRARCSKRTACLTTAESAVMALACASKCHC
jgi:hypothetical protein